jgi:hypothetical protein
MTMPSGLTAKLAVLKDLNLSLRQLLEAAEAKIPPLNEQILQLATIDLVRDAALLGEMIYDKAYGPIPSETDNSLLLQVALLVPEGLGLVAWDREEFLALRGEGPGYRGARLRFVPFNELGSALKAMLLPHVEPLLDRLLVIADISRRPRAV